MTAATLLVGVRRLQATEFRAAGFAVDMQGEPGAKVYRYVLDEHGEHSLVYDETDRDITHLSRLLAMLAVQGCELGISRPAEAALVARMLQHTQPPGAGEARSKRKRKRAS